MLVPTNRVICDICKTEFHEDEFDYDEVNETNVCPFYMVWKKIPLEMLYRNIELAAPK